MYAIGKFDQYAYVGNYHAVYLDEIKRSDGSVEAQQFGELLKRVRYGKFDQYAYVGNYNAVYLDEIKRSDGSVEAQQFGELLKRVRYGKFDQYAYVGNYMLCIWMRSKGVMVRWKHNSLENY